MKPRIQALRAISSEYAATVINPILYIVTAVCVVVLALLLFLVIKVSLRWLILFVPMVGFSLLITSVSSFVLIIAKSVAPNMNQEQQAAVTAYVSNMKEVSDGIQTPQFMIIFYIAKDLFTKKWETGFVQSLTKNSVRLKQDFESLVATF